MFNLINIPRPLLFPEDKWNSLRETSLELFVSAVKDRATYLPEDLIEILESERPNTLNEQTWEGIRNQIEQIYIDGIAKKLILDENALKKLHSYNLSSLSEKSRQKLMSTVASNSYIVTLRNLLVSESPLEYVSNQELRGMTEEQIEHLKRKAYEEQMHLKLPHLSDEKGVKLLLEEGKPDWLKDDDFVRYINESERHAEIKEKLKQREDKLEQEISSLTQQKQTYTNRLKALEEFIIEGTLMEQASSSFDDESWRRLKLVETSWKNNISEK